MSGVVLRDIGLTDYAECRQLQQGIFDALIERKDRGEAGEQTLILCEHPHVYTLGKSGKAANMLIGEEFLRKIGASFHRTDRGGDITYHGPGQLVGYPILDIEALGLGLKEYVGLLEQSVIDTLAEFGIAGSRLQGATGVWLPPDSSRGERKICAIGVRSSRFVTMHGFALNVAPALEYFSYINPCGFVDKGVTSMAAELGASVSMDDVKRVYIEKFGKLFGVEILL